MNYNIEILKESGYEEALLGLSLSYNQPVCNMKSVADKIYANGSHGKFLESVCVWLDITMPRYWWQEFATYRINTSCNSESTMHTITKRLLTQSDFIEDINEAGLAFINSLIEDYQRDKAKGIENSSYYISLLRRIKRNLPEGFLQRRTVCTSYKTIRHIIAQREKHKLEEWQIFCDYLKDNLRYKEWLK